MIDSKPKTKTKEAQTLLLSLAILHDGERVLLGRKKRGFGSGKWNGFGGKVKDDETVEDCVRREIAEECGLEALAVEPAGRLTFTFDRDPVEFDVHVFAVPEFRGEARETDEMAPRWFAVDDMPFDEMWAADRFWLPLLLAGKRFVGSFHYTDDAVIVTHSLIAIDGCPICGQRDCGPGSHRGQRSTNKVAKTAGRQ